MTGMVEAGKEKGRDEIHHFLKNEILSCSSIDDYDSILRLKQNKREFVLRPQKYKI
jgi:hypothetical protein